MLIEEKNREILRLRMHNEEANSRIGRRPNMPAYPTGNEMTDTLDPH